MLQREGAKASRALRCVAFAIGILALVPARAATVLRSSVEDLARGADAVLRGRVERCVSRWDGGRIVTEVVVARTELWRGSAPERATIVVPGGEAGGVAQHVAGAPSFAPGEDVVVFLARAGAGRFRVAGFAQGKFRVEGEVARPDLSETTLVGPPLAAGARPPGPVRVHELRRTVRGAP